MRFPSYSFFNPSTPEGLRGFSCCMEVLLGGGSGVQPRDLLCSRPATREPPLHPTGTPSHPGWEGTAKETLKFARVVIPLNLLQLPEREVDQEQMVD